MAEHEVDVCKLARIAYQKLHKEGDKAAFRFLSESSPMNPSYCSAFLKDNANSSPALFEEQLRELVSLFRRNTLANWGSR